MGVCKKERGMSTQRLQDCKTARLQIMQGVFRYVKCFSHFFRVRDITILIERIPLCHTLSIRYNYENSKARWLSCTMDNVVVPDDFLTTRFTVLRGRYRQ